MNLVEQGSWQYHINQSTTPNMTPSPSTTKSSKPYKNHDFEVTEFTFE